MRYVHHTPLRWSDMDVYGHINNARFLTLYEEARVALFFTGARQRGLTSFEDGIVISRHEIDYVRPVDFGVGPHAAARSPEVRIDMWVDEIRHSRFVVAYEMFDCDLVVSRARSVCVPFDLANQRPRRLTEGERAFLSEWGAVP